MTATDTILGAGLTALGILLLVPAFVMVVVMPLLLLTGFGQLPAGLGGWERFLVPLLPFTVFLGLGYLLYTGVVERSDRSTESELDELRSAYARGTLTDEEFEKRRFRLRATDHGSTETEVSSRD